jgi:PleD family two-component response regulator
LRQHSSGSVIGEVQEEPTKQIASKAHESTSSPVPPAAEASMDAGKEELSAEKMHVLVAEDDPVNSKIVKKRLEKLGHEIVLTSNGEECAQAYADGSEGVDAVLMDMQVS